MKKHITMSLTLTPAQWALVESGIARVCYEMRESQDDVMNDDVAEDEEIAELPVLDALVDFIFDKRGGE